MSKQIMIEKGTINVVRNHSNAFALVSKDERFSIVPMGVFEKAKLIVTSENFKEDRTRARRGAGNKKRRKWKKRGNKGKKNKEEEGCKLHEHQIDFAEVCFFVLTLLYFSKYYCDNFSNSAVV